MHADSQSRRLLPAREHVDLAVEVFRMLSDATRVQLLWALLDGEMPVNELADAVGKPATGVSQHLAKLRMARLVTTRRQANQVFYRIENAHVRQLVEDAIYQAEHAAGGIPEHHRADGGLHRLHDPDADGASGSRGRDETEKAQ
jgi:DNA-binding transcriptional ArsR family regulator